jgi:hypothetical protein
MIFLLELPPIWGAIITVLIFLAFTCAIFIIAHMIFRGKRPDETRTFLEHFGTPDSYAALGFEAYFRLKQALDQCVPDYSRDCLAAKIRNVQSFTGVFGKYAIKDGDSLRPVIVSEIQDGSLQLLVKVY